MIWELLLLIAVVVGWPISGIVIGSITLLLKASLRRSGKRLGFIKEVLALSRDDWFEEFIKLGPVSVFIAPFMILFPLDPRREYQMQSMAEWEGWRLTIDQNWTHGQRFRVEQWANESIERVDKNLEPLEQWVEKVPVKTRRFAWASALATILLTPIARGTELMKMLFIQAASESLSVTNPSAGTARRESSDGKDTGDKPVHKPIVKIWGDGAASYQNSTGSFAVDRVQVYATVTQGKLTSFFHLNPLIPSTIVKAYVDYRAGPFSLKVGQQSVPVKFITPPPEKSWTGSSSLSSLIPIFDDIGVSVTAKKRLLNAFLGVFNGTGRNRKDDNREKDFSLRAQLTPQQNFSFAGTFHSGRQPNGMRSCLSFDSRADLSQMLEVNGAYLRRIDLQRDGWFVNWLFKASNIHFVTQFLREGVAKDLTVGTNMYFERLKVQPNLILSNKKGPEILLKVQTDF